MSCSGPREGSSCRHTETLATTKAFNLNTESRLGHGSRAPLDGGVRPRPRTLRTDSGAVGTRSRDEEERPSEETVEKLLLSGESNRFHVRDGLTLGVSGKSSLLTLDDTNIAEARVLQCSPPGTSQQPRPD